MYKMKTPRSKYDHLDVHMQHDLGRSILIGTSSPLATSSQIHRPVGVHNHHDLYDMDGLLLRSGIFICIFIPQKNT